MCVGWGVGGGRVHMSDPDDDMFKNSGIPSYKACLGRG